MSWLRNKQRVTYVGIVFASVFCGSFVVSAQITPPHNAKATATAKSLGNDFVLNAAKPFVYLEFLKIASRKGSPGEVPTGIWLRLVNNCRLAIELDVNGGVDGPQPGHRVVYDEYSGVIAYDADGRRDPPEQIPRSQMPFGYDFGDVWSNWVLQPGQELTFSIPINHISSDWHVELPFEFVLQAEKQPQMHADFHLWDIPDKFQLRFQDSRRSSR